MSSITMSAPRDRQAIIDDLTRGGNAPLTRFDEVMAAISKTLARNKADVDASESVPANVRVDDAAGIAEELTQGATGVAGRDDAGPSKAVAANAPAGSTVSATTPLTYQQIMEKVRRVPEGHELAGQASVYDVIQLVTGKNRNDSAEDFRKLEDKVPNLNVAEFQKFQFRGKGQRRTPVAQFETILKIVHALRGKSAEAFKAHNFQTLVRVIAGDRNMHAVLDQNREAMRPEDRRAILGGVPGAEVVDEAEASAGDPLIDAWRARNAHLPPTDPRTLPWHAHAPAEERTVNVRGHEFLAETRVREGAVVPAMFDKRALAYINFAGFHKALRQPLWKLGHTDDAAARFSRHISQYKFACTRPCVLLATGDRPAKAVEDKIKEFAKDAMFRVGPCTESFACPVATMLGIVGDAFTVSADAVDKIWMHPSISADIPDACALLRSAVRHGSQSTAPRGGADWSEAVELSREETKRTSEVEQTKRERLRTLAALANKIDKLTPEQAMALLG